MNTRFIWMLAVVLSSVAIAQPIPKEELFLGYNFVRMNSGTQVPAFSANGGNGQFIGNYHRVIGVVADFGAYHNGVINGVNIDNTVFSYLFGPRFSIRNHSRWTPYFSTLVGGVRASASAPVVVTPVNTACDCRVSGSQNAFAMALGGGLDVRLAKYVSFRPIGVDYFYTRLQDPVSMLNHNQHNLRYSAGIVFMFPSD